MPPLADRMRPTHLDEILGQQRWLGPGSPLRQSVSAGTPYSMVLWGPPGCGKTTIARVIAHHCALQFAQLSAVLDGVKDLRKLLEQTQRPLVPAALLLFVDEIHRWNKSQQDALLPHLESGDITLIGATTENPSMQLNAALRSRLQIVRLDPLSPEDITHLLERALDDPRGIPSPPTIEEGVLEMLAHLSSGDARQALGDLERAVLVLPKGAPLTREHVNRTLQREDLRHDPEDHFNVVSALIKSMRGSDPDASLYWLARMIAAGEDAAYIARRLVIFASEDIGNADPRALQVAAATATAVQMIGYPEARIPLAQAVTWLACSPKSNAAYKAIDAALEDVRTYGALPVPLHLRNPSTAEMRREGYGRGYRYPHDHPDHIVDQQHFPERLRGRQYYHPVDYGEERTISHRRTWWARRLRDREEE